jgi:hypothetical protein
MRQFDENFLYVLRKILLNRTLFGTVFSMETLKSFFNQAAQWAEDCQEFFTTHYNRLRAAFSDQSPLVEERSYHRVKAISLCALTLFCAATLNIEGLVGAVIAEGDEIRLLEEAGREALTKKSDMSGPGPV